MFVPFVLLSFLVVIVVRLFVCLFVVLSFLVVIVVRLFVMIQDDLALSSEAVLGLSYHDMSVLIDGLAKEMEMQGTGIAHLHHTIITSFYY